MLEEDQLQKIKETIEEVLGKMTLAFFSVRVSQSQTDNKLLAGQTISRDLVNIEIKLDEPKFLIGQNGQTLFEFQKIIKLLIQKKLQLQFYVNVDVNDYKKSKVEYLKKMAYDAANEVYVRREKKSLPPMPAYERRVIHEALSLRSDVATTSEGEGEKRCIIISPLP